MKIHPQNALSTGLSPEAMTLADFHRQLQLLGPDSIAYIQHLRDTNGNTEPRGDDPSIIWAMRNKWNCRLCGANDKSGNYSLTIVRTHSLCVAAILSLFGMDEATATEKEAVVAQAPFDIVWLSTDAFLRIVGDAVKTGYPRNVTLLCGLNGDNTVEHEVPCKHLVTPAGLAEFSHILAGGWKRLVAAGRNA